MSHTSIIKHNTNILEKTCGTPPATGSLYNHPKGHKQPINTTAEELKDPTLIIPYEFKIFMAVTFLVMFFGVKSPWGLVGRSQHFKKACCLHLQDCSDEMALEGPYIYRVLGVGVCGKAANRGE
jgi:hypothetical protein